MRPADLEAVVALQAEGSIAALGHIFRQEVNPFPQETIRRRWLQELSDPKVDCFVIQAHDIVQGFAAIRGSELLHFGTSPSTWGSGLARQAHDELLDHLRSQEAQRARLWVFQDNGHAKRFYQHRGWKPTGRRTRSTFPPHAVLLEYHRELTGHDRADSGSDS